LKDRIDEFLSRATARWVAGVLARARLVCILSVAMALALGSFAALRLGINSDNVRMLADTIPSKIAHVEFSRYFPNLDNALLIVIDAKTPALARDASQRLAASLTRRSGDFTDVYIPGGGSFFERSGLLYRSAEELDQFADQMARLQPVLAQLEVDPSIASLAGMIRMGLEAIEKAGEGEEGEEAWSMILDRVGHATVSIYDEFPIAISWEEVLLRGSSIEVTTRRVVIAHPILDFDSILAAGRSLQTVRETARELGLTPERGVRLRITGNPALNYEEMVGLAWDIGGAGAFCFLLVCGVLYLALRSVRLMIAAVATLLIGLICTAAFAAATVQQLNLLSISFAVLFIGLGVDFAIHLTMRYADLLRSGAPDTEALPEAAAQVGSSLVICTTTTAIGFFVFLPSEYRGVAELGLIAGAGMFIILALTLTTLPALLGHWLRLDPSRPPTTRVRFSGDWLRRLAESHRAIRLFAALGFLGALGLLFKPGVHFDSNVIRMRNAETESVQAFDDLMEMATTSPWYANLVADDLQEADRLAQQLRSFEVVEQALTLSDYIPSNQDEKLEILADVAMLLETPGAASATGILGSPPGIEEQVEALRDLKAFLESGWVDASSSPLAASMALLRDRLTTYLARIDRDGDPAAALESLEDVLLSRLPAQIGRLRDAIATDGVQREDLPPGLVRRMLAPTGQARVQVFPSENLQNADALERFVTALRGVDPMASGVSINLFDFGRATVSSFERALTLAVVLISLLLWMLWRSLREVWLAMTPLILSSVLTLAAMAALGIDFNFANVIVLPLLLGIGVDSGIHLVHRAKMRRSPTELLLETTTARAVFYSALTTVVSFGTLAFSAHRGVASLGVLLTVGMLLTIVCNLIVLPALIDWRNPRNPPDLPPAG
jgi:hopanoid biosynthesis associated RND transporter like protein HpnN